MVDRLFDGAADDVARVEAGLVSVDMRLQDISAQARNAQTQLQSLGKVGDTFTQSLGVGVDQLTRGMSNAFERFLRTGKLSFADLKSVAINALDAIYDRAINAGLNSIFGGAGGANSGGLLGTILSGGPILSFAPRAMGGPVAAGRPFLVGEAGPEIFIPGQGGNVVRPHTASAPAINVTINMGGQQGQSSAAMRQSANQIAAQVSRAVARAQRNG